MALMQKIKNKIIRMLVSGNNGFDSLLHSDLTDQEKQNIEKVRPYTMTGVERLVSLSRAIEYIETNNIEGDILECGVWKGGSMMMAAIRLQQLGNNTRKLFLFDTFEGMSEPTELDKSVSNQKAKDLLEQSGKEADNNIWCYSPIDEVKNNVLSTAYDAEKIFFVKGKVEDTIPDSRVGNIALLRLDTDWYESTKHELEHLYDKLVPGGVLIIDDYGHWSGAKKAVDEFIKNRGLKLFLNRIDYTGRLAIKP